MEEIHEAPAPSAAPAVVPDGLSNEEYVSQLQAQAESARRAGDDATAEERMLQVLDYEPHDQKATTYLERRFRARGDWASLRDLLLKSAGAPHLPPAVQTVRLREAARLSEEQLGDLDGAITAWRTIQENDPKVRDAADALKRLLAETERWDELIEVLENEAATTKSRAQAHRRLPPARGDSPGPPRRRGQGRGGLQEGPGSGAGGRRGDRAPWTSSISGSSSTRSWSRCWSSGPR